MRLQNHLEKAKAVTLKSKLHLFRDEIDQNKKDESDGKLGEILKRNMSTCSNKQEHQIVPNIQIE
jgi:hypothetical protein